MKLLSMVAICALVVTLSAVAQPPNKISYQGMLTTPSGAPVSGTYDLQFDLFDVATGGTTLFSETHLSVSVQQGSFSVLLGSVSSLPPIFDQPLFVQITIPPSTVFSPRSELASTPYALGPWSLTGSDISYSGGNVGIGTTTPGAKLEVTNGYIRALDNGTNINPGPGQGAELVAAYGNSYLMSVDRPSNNGLPLILNASSIDLQIAGVASGLYVSSSANVGIGTTNPGAKLEVNSGDVVFTGLSSTVGKLSLGDVTSSIFSTGLYRTAWGQAADALNVQGLYRVVFNTGYFDTPVERMRIEGENVGIGTTSPTEKLDVAGKTKTTNFQMTNGAATNYVLTSDATGNASWTAPSGGIGGSGALNYIPKFTPNGTMLGNSTIIDDGTNVGIGITPTNNARLEVNGGGTGGIRVEGYGINGGGLRIVNTDVSTQEWTLQGLGTSGFFGPSKGFAISDITNSKNPLLVEANTPNNTLYLKNSGNVGIGTTNPTDKFYISQSLSGLKGITVQQTVNGVGNEGTIAVLHNVAGYGWRARASDSDGGFRLDVENASTWISDAIAVTSMNGNVGIGTASPTEKLEVAGNIKVGNATIRSGTGSPLGVVTGNVGDLFLRTNGGAGTTLYVKETGNGTNTGWAAK